MEKTEPNYKKFIFVCTNVREPGQSCCGARGGDLLRDTLKAKVKSLGLGTTIRVSRTGCQGPCEEGPNVLVFPEYIWYKGVQESDLEAILKEHVLPIITE